MASPWVVGYAKSADTIVLWNLSVEPPLERVVSLMYVESPKFHFEPSPDRSGASRPVSEQPYAWAAREYLRTTLFVNHPPCEYTECFKTPNNRSLGILTVQYQGEQVNVAHRLVQQGLASVKRRQKYSRQEREDMEPLQEAESEAHSRNLRLHSSVRSARHVEALHGADVATFISKHKGTVIPSFLVEMVTDDAACLKGYVVPLEDGKRPADPLDARGVWLAVTVRIAGIARLSGAAATSGRLAIERAIIGKVVRIRVEDSAADSADAILGSVLRDRDGVTVQSVLLEKGVLRLDEASAPADLLAALQPAEAAAYKAKVGMWASAADGTPVAPPASVAAVAAGPPPAAAPARSATPSEAASATTSTGRRTPPDRSEAPPRSPPSPPDSSPVPASAEQHPAPSAPAPSPHRLAPRPRTSTVLHFEEIRCSTTGFAIQRQWDEWQTPRNLLTGMSFFLGNIATQLLHTHDGVVQQREELRSWAADLFICVMRFATKFGFDPGTGRAVAPCTPWDKQPTVPSSVPAPSSINEVFLAATACIGRISGVLQWWGDGVLQRIQPARRAAVNDSIMRLVNLCLQMFAWVDADTDPATVIQRQITLNAQRYRPAPGGDHAPPGP